MGRTAAPEAHGHPNAIESPHQGPCTVEGIPLLLSGGLLFQAGSLGDSMPLIVFQLDGLKSSGLFPKTQGNDFLVFNSLLLQSFVVVKWH